MTEPEEQRALDDLRAGRPEACAALVRAHYAAVYRFLVHLTRDVHQAEDLTQETFAAAWRKVGTFRGDAAPGTWLCRIAYTKFIDSRRAEGRARAMRRRVSPARASPGDPLDAVAADDEARRLYQALHALEAPERAVLTLHYLQGRSYREMAAVLGEPTGTVKWRTAEAVRRLRAVLGEEVPDHAPGRKPGPGSIP